MRESRAAIQDFNAFRLHVLGAAALFLGDRVRIPFAVFDRLASNADRDVLLGVVLLLVAGPGSDVLADHRRRAAFARIAQRHMLVLVLALFVDVVILGRRMPVLVRSLVILGGLGALIRMLTVALVLSHWASRESEPATGGGPAFTRLER